MKKLILPLFFLVYSTKAQEKFSLTLYFPSNSSRLTTTAKSRVDSAVKPITSGKVNYVITIDGHTDNEGSLDLNKTLSLNRALAIKGLLIKKGFKQEHIVSNGYAYLKPAADNTADVGRSKNRRVTLYFELQKPDYGKAIGHQAFTSKYEIKSSEPANLLYTSGSKIHIPANAFVTYDGKPVSGKVNIEYTEYRNKLDFIACNIPMSFHRDSEFVQFNSAGMLSIGANQDNKKLKLKPGANVIIEFVKAQDLDSMGVYSYNSADGQWSDAVTSQIRSNQFAGFKFASNFQPSVGRPYCATTTGGEDRCLLNDVYGARFALRKGHELAGAASSVNLHKPNLYFLHHWNGRIPTYKMESLSHQKNGTRFWVNVVAPLSLANEYSEWIYSDNEERPYDGEWEKKVWLAMKTEHLAGKDYALTLRNNSRSMRFILKSADRSCKKNMNVQSSVWTKDGLLSSLDGVASFTEIYLSPAGRLYDSPCSDSLFCFYQHSKQWMPDSTNEKNMSFTEWFDYFNENKKMMRARYLELNKDIKHIIADLVAESKARIVAEQKKRSRFDSIAGITQSSVDKVTELMSISNLGIWNCDQIMRLSDPIYVRSGYSDRRGNKIEPVGIFVVNPGINGVLAFSDGEKLSPYCFPVSSRAENTVIAFDNLGNVFVSKPADLRKRINNEENYIVVDAIAKNELSTVINTWLK